MKFLVELFEMDYYDVVVEADDEVEAEHKAWDQLTDDEGRFRWHQGSDGDVLNVEQIE